MGAISRLLRRRLGGVTAPGSHPPLSRTKALGQGSPGNAGGGRYQLQVHNLVAYSQNECHDGCRPAAGTPTPCLASDFAEEADRFPGRGGVGDVTRNCFVEEGGALLTPPALVFVCSRRLR